MMKRHEVKRQWVWAIITAFGFALILGCSPKSESEKKVIKLGAVLPITGPNANLGQETSNAAKLAVKQWNDAGKIPGYTLEYVVEDDASDAKQATAAATRISGDATVLGVVSHFNSGCLLPSSPIYHRAGLMAISPAATNPQVTLQGFPEIARVCSNDNVQGMAAAQFLNRRGKKLIAIVHDKTQYGEGLAKVLQTEATALGLTIQSFDGINVGDKDFKALLTQIKSQNPEVVYFGGLQEEASFLVRQMRELQISAEFVSDDGVYGQDFLKNAADLAEGAIVSFPSTPIEKLPNADAFFKAYEAEYNTPVLNWGPYGYDAATILLEAIKQSVVDSGPDALRKKVVKFVRETPHQGLLGDLTLDKNGDPVNQTFSFYQVKSGKFDYLETVNRMATP